MEASAQSVQGRCLLNDSGTSPESSQPPLIRAAPRHPRGHAVAAAPSPDSALRLSPRAGMRIGRQAVRRGKRWPRTIPTMRRAARPPRLSRPLCRSINQPYRRAARGDGAVVGATQGHRSDAGCADTARLRARRATPARRPNAYVVHPRRNRRPPHLGRPSAAPSVAPRRSIVPCISSRRLRSGTRTRCDAAQLSHGHFRSNEHLP